MDYNLEKYLATLPEHMRPGLQIYWNHGILPGSFLQAVLRNDLVGAVGAADEINIRLLPVYASVMYNAFPSRGSGVWGSSQAMDDWSRVGGLKGIQTSKSDPQVFNAATLGEETARRLAALVTRFGGSAEAIL